MVWILLTTRSVQMPPSQAFPKLGHTDCAINDNGDAMRILAKCLLTTMAECHATDVEKLPSSGIEPEIFCYRGRCSNH